MSLVLDASMTIAWYIDEEATQAADAVLDEVVASSAIKREASPLALQINLSDLQ